MFAKNLVRPWQGHSAPDGGLEFRFNVLVFNRFHAFLCVCRLGFQVLEGSEVFFHLVCLFAIASASMALASATASAITSTSDGVGRFQGNPLGRVVVHLSWRPVDNDDGIFARVC